MKLVRWHRKDKKIVGFKNHALRYHFERPTAKHPSKLYVNLQRDRTSKFIDVFVPKLGEVSLTWITYDVKHRWVHGLRGDQERLGKLAKK